MRVNPLNRAIIPLEYFFISVLINLFLPIMPICLELLLKGSVAAENATISAAMYAACIAFTTIHPVFAVINILICILFTTVFGFTIASSSVLNINTLAPSAAIALMFIACTFERYVLHVVYKEEYRLFGVLPLLTILRKSLHGSVWRLHLLELD
jgi:hypothetical protein